MEVKKRTNEIDTHIGIKLRYFRRMRNMSQTALSQNLGITFQQLQKYERGSNRISASRLFQIANILGLNMIDFFEGLDGYELQKKSENQTNSLENPEIISFLSDWNKIKNKDVKSSIKTMVKNCSLQNY